MITKCLNGSTTKKAFAFTGSTVTTHELCLNAIVDAVVSRTKLGNVATPCGGKEVPVSNLVTAVVSKVGTVRVGSDEITS